MNLEKILSIVGKPGLFELKIQTRTGFVAESLLDGKKITVSNMLAVIFLFLVNLIQYVSTDISSNLSRD